MMLYYATVIYLLHADYNNALYIIHVGIGAIIIIIAL